jgi:hemoglobin
MATPKSLYDNVGGFDKILEVTRRWHELCLQDPAAAHPFEQPLHPQHDERLAAYLAEALGGPKLYTAGYGNESQVQRVHAGHGEHIELDEACLKQFDYALQDVGITGPDGQSFSAYFRRATEEMRVFSVRDAAVPDGLPINYAS